MSYSSHPPFRNLRPRFVQADEIWGFVHTKQNRLSPKSLKGWGDAYVWIAMDADTKLILSYLVGKRDPNSCYAFIRDLSKRIRGRFQLSTDGLRSYIPAVEEYFGAEVDYAQVVKVYRTGANEHPDWYRSSDVIRVVPTPVTGNPDRKHISTAFIERANLSVRMHLRRFTRMTNAYSKKRANLTAAVSLYMAWYNFCRVHSTLRVTPAMESGLADHIWSIEELVAYSWSCG